MLTKLILHIDGKDYELRDDDLSNWEEIKCSYKRASFDGVIRSFTSQFEFVNRAKDMLIELYLRDFYNAKASVSIYTMTDRWDFVKRFEALLDFTTIQWEGHKVQINSVDNSLSALIKANKSTKYEFEIGKDIQRNDVLNFDRVPMKESVTYEFTQGTQFDNCADIIVKFERNKLPWIGNVGTEITVNGKLDWNEDQETDDGSYILKAYKDVDVDFNFELEWRSDFGYGDSIELSIHILRNGRVITPSGGNSFALMDSHNYVSLGTFESPSQLPNPVNVSDPVNSYAIIDDVVWSLRYSGRFVWNCSGKSLEDFFISAKSGHVALSLLAGDLVYISHELNSQLTSVQLRIVKSRFVFDWMSRGDSISIDVFKPVRVANELLRKIAGGKVNADVYISPFDSRLSNTYILPGESIRGLSGAKLYSSFNEFCDWMSAVFGYVYYIGDPQPSRYKFLRECGQIEYSPWAYLDETFNGDVDTKNIVYIPAHGRFVYLDSASGKVYSSWNGSDGYNDPETGHPRLDTIYRIKELSETALYYFNSYNGTDLLPEEYDHSEDFIGNDGQTVYFVHRFEVFSSESGVHTFRNCKDVKYSVDSGAIYSSVTVGYDKKDYDSINGRDEFNFNNTYTTGCTISDKKLSLISKYRADSYGIEFTAQKRGKDTTDSNADNNVFFALCKKADRQLVIDRSSEIENALSDGVFNGEYSPMACVRANAGYIGLQAAEMTLTFASSEGNSSIVIDGEPMNGNITLNTPLAMSGTLEFTTDEIDDIVNVNELIEVSDDGMIYRGFLQEADVLYARPEAAKYKLIVKDIEL